MVRYQNKTWARVDFDYDTNKQNKLGTLETSPGTAVCPVPFANFVEGDALLAGAVVFDFEGSVALEGVTSASCDERTQL